MSHSADVPTTTVCSVGRGGDIVESLDDDPVMGTSSTTGGATSGTTTVTLISKDDPSVRFTLPSAHAELSGLVKAALAVAGAGEGGVAWNHDLVVDCDPRALGHMVRYLEHHAGRPGDVIPTPIKSKDLYVCVPDRWDADFIVPMVRTDMPMLKQLIRQGNYLRIECLVRLVAVAIASIIKGHPVEELERRLAPIHTGGGLDSLMAAATPASASASS